MGLFERVVNVNSIERKERSFQSRFHAAAHGFSRPTPEACQLLNIVERGIGFRAHPTEYVPETLFFGSEEGIRRKKKADARALRRLKYTARYIATRHRCGDARHSQNTREDVAARTPLVDHATEGQSLEYVGMRVRMAADHVAATVQIAGGARIEKGACAEQARGDEEMTFPAATVEFVGGVKRPFTAVVERDQEMLARLLKIQVEDAAGSETGGRDAVHVSRKDLAGLLVRTGGTELKAGLSGIVRNVVVEKGGDASGHWFVFGRAALFVWDDELVADRPAFRRNVHRFEPDHVVRFAFIRKSLGAEAAFLDFIHKAAIANNFSGHAQGISGVKNRNGVDQVAVVAPVDQFLADALHAVLPAKIIKEIRGHVAGAPARANGETAFRENPTERFHFIRVPCK